jgi:putative ABC transport system permease protein
MPDWKPHIRLRLASLRLSPTRENEIMDELAQHLDDRWRELLASGASENEAIRLALAQLGDDDTLARNLAPLKQARLPPSVTPGVPTGHWLSDVCRDLRYAARLLRKQPGFSATAILILALGIGASTAMFSVIDAVLLRPLPYPSADRVVTLWGRSTQMSRTSVSLPDYRDWQQRSHSFEHLALIRPDDVPVSMLADPRMTTTALVTANFFQVFNLSAQIGRTLTAADDQPNAAPAAVLSHAIWRTRLAGDPQVIGRAIRVGDQPYTIVGVMSPAFNMPIGTDVWLAFGPQAGTEAWQGRGNRPGFMAVGMLAPGVDATDAQRDMSSIAAQLAAEYAGSNAGFDVIVTPIMESLVGDYRRPLWILLASVGLFLLIACANVGNLLLVRGTQRQRELAVRIALGATKRQIHRQLLTETAVLAATGIAVGILMAWSARGALLALGIEGPPRFQDVSISLPVLLFAITVGGLTSIAAGVWPAWRVSTTDPKEAMDAEGRTGTARSTRRLQATFVVSQVAVTLTLVVGGMQLLRSFERARTANLGFVTEGLWSARLMLPAGRYLEPAEQHRLVERFLVEARSLRGVEAVAISSDPPLAPGWQAGFMIEGQSDLGSQNPFAEMNRVSSSYFRTMGVSLIRGRDFLPDDLPNHPRVAIVDQAMAENAWPDQDPLGKRFFLPGPNWKENPLTVIGVVPTLRVYGYGLAPRNAQIYLPESQSPVRNFFVVTRSRTGLQGFENAVRETVRRLDADVVVTNARTMSDRIGDTVASLRLMSTLAAVFAGLALLLATVGLHAIIAYDVAQRLREIGLRLALGAEPRRVVAMVLRQGLALTALGSVAGLAAATALTQSLRSVLVGLEPVDGWSVCAALLLLTAASGLACWWPARRASRLSPLEVLRHS